MELYTLYFTDVFGGKWKTHGTKLDEETVLFQAMHLLKDGKAEEVRIGKV